METVSIGRAYLEFRTLDMCSLIAISFMYFHVLLFDKAVTDGDLGVSNPDHCRRERLKHPKF